MGRVLGHVTIKFLGPLFISGIAADADFKIGTYRYIDVLNGSAFLSVAHRRSLFYVLLRSIVWSYMSGNGNKVSK